MLISTFVAVGGPNNLIAQIHRYIRDAISVRSIIPSNFDDHVQRVTHLHAFLPKKKNEFKHGALQNELFMNILIRLAR